jgi:hypothetical protein
VGQVRAPVREDSLMLFYRAGHTSPPIESRSYCLLGLIFTTLLTPTRGYGIAADTWFEKELSTLLPSTAVTT